MTQPAPRQTGPRPIAKADELPPPTDLAAEKAVLCALVLGVGGDALDGLESRWFYVPGHRRTVEAALTLRASGTSVDVITLAASLKTSGHLEEVGGTPFLRELFDASPDTHNLPDHLAIVRRAALARLLDAHCTTAKAMLRTGSDPEQVAAFMAS